MTFPSPLLLPLPYGQHFACGKNQGNLLRLSTPESFQRQKEKPPDFGWLLIGAGYERNVCDVSKSPLAALALWAAFCLRQKPRELASPLHPRIFSAAKRKTTRFWVASNWSRLRGSNSLPPPWQGGALPDELNLRCRQRCLLYRTAGQLSRNFFNHRRVFPSNLCPGRKDPFLPKQETEQRPGAKTAGTCPSNFRLRQNDLPDG